MTSIGALFSRSSAFPCIKKPLYQEARGVFVVVLYSD